MWPYTTEEATWLTQPAECAATASAGASVRRTTYPHSLNRPLPIPANDHPANDDGIFDPQVILRK